MNELNQSAKLSVIMIGATGAVGGEVLKQLIALDNVVQITLLNRREIGLDSSKITQHIVDVLKPDTYREFMTGHDIAISTFGVGQPLKTPKEDFIKIDKHAVLEFANLCKSNGVTHFGSLGSVGSSSRSSQYYLKTKGELEDGLRDLGFDRLSLFHPSMILTPTNRYGFSQWLTLKAWPLLTPILIGPLRKFRGINVAQLGRAIANNVRKSPKQSVEILEWDDFISLQ